jgi:gluconate kinase
MENSLSCNWFNSVYVSWLHNLDDNMKKITMGGVTVICYAIQRYRNDIIFNKIKYYLFIYTTFVGTYWLHFWMHQ